MGVCCKTSTDVLRSGSGTGVYRSVEVAEGPRKGGGTVSFDFPGGDTPINLGKEKLRVQDRDARRATCDLQDGVGDVFDTGTSRYRGKRMNENERGEVDTPRSSVSSGVETLELDGARAPEQARDKGPTGDSQRDVGNVIDTGVGIHRGRLSAEWPQKRTRTHRAKGNHENPLQPLKQVRHGMVTTSARVRVQSGVRNVGSLDVSVLRHHVRQPSYTGSDSLLHAERLLSLGKPCRYDAEKKVAPGDGSLASDSENSVKDIGVSDHTVRLGLNGERQVAEGPRTPARAPSSSSTHRYGSIQVEKEGGRVLARDARRPRGDLQHGVGSVSDTGVIVHRGVRTADMPRNRSSSPPRTSSCSARNIDDGHGGLEENTTPNIICAVQSVLNEIGGRGSSGAHVKQKLHIDSCATIHCTGRLDSLQNQRVCSLEAEDFRSKKANASIVGDLYIVLMAERPDALEPRLLLLREVYYFEDAPRTLISYPKLCTKGCKLLLSKHKSLLTIPEKDGHGANFDVPVFCEDGHMPYIAPLYVGASVEAKQVYDSEVRKSHWHLNAIDARPSTRAQIEPGRPVSGGGGVRVSSAAAVGDVHGVPMPIGTRTRSQVMNAARTVVSADVMDQILKCDDIGIISVGTGGLDGFVTAGRVFGIPILGGFEKHSHRKELHERFHAVPLGHDAKSIPSQYLRDIDSRAAKLGVKRRIGCFSLPCQPYSTAGKMLGAADPRAFTIKDVLNIQAEIRGDALIFENVGSTPQEHLSSLQNALEELGYYVSQCRRDASTIGNAQVRTRVFLCAIQGGPISIQKVVKDRLDFVPIRDLLDAVPSEGVFVDFDFELTSAPRIHDNKPTLLARFRGWEKVRSHWPGLGYSIHSPAGRCPVLRAYSCPRREDQPAGPRGTVLWEGRPRAITVLEACRIQGFDTTWLDRIDDITATELIGEAVCVEHGGSILAETLKYMLLVNSKMGPEHHAIDALANDLDVSAPVDMLDSSARGKFRVRTSSRGITREQAHRRWGHCGRDMLNMLPFYQQFTPHTHYYREDDWHCEACQLANNITNPKPKTSGADGGVQRHRIKTTKVGDIVHIDPLGKQKAFSIEGHTTAMVIIDDYSRFAVVKLLKRKGDMQEAFRTYCLQYVKPLRVRCDGEAATMLHATCTKMGIILEPSIPQRQHQNGIVERYIGLLQERARVFRVQSQVPDALNMHAIAYVAQMMRFMPQATRGFQTAYELANGFPHKKPDPVQAVFGCLVYAVNTRRLQTDKVSKRTLKGVFIGFGNHDRLDANCRAIRIFCLERNAIILSDPLQCKFFNNIFPFQVMRTKAPHLDAMVKIRLKTTRGEATMQGAVIAFEAPLYTIVLEDGRLVRARSGDLSTWMQAYKDRNADNAIVPIVEKNNLSRWEMGSTNLVASLTVAQAQTPYDLLDPRGFVRDPVGPSLRAHGGFVVPDFDATLAHRPDAARGFHDGRIHMRGDTLALPPRFLRRHIDKPFIGSVVSAWKETSDGHRTFVVSTELGDSTVRKFDSEVLQSHSILLQPTVQKHTLAHYAQATGQDIELVRNVPHQMVSLAFDPKSEANVIAWAATEHAHDGAYDTLVDIDEKTMREFDKPPDSGNVSSVDGFIRSMDAAAQALQQHDIHLDPQNDRQADQSEHHAKWKGARDKETDALFRNKVIASESATRAEIGRASVLSMKWVYKLKSDGTFKARLVIRGFTQREGDNTYDKDMVLSPTAHGPSVRILLASAVQLGRHVGTFDVANAFQQGEFIAGEVIFVRMPKNAGGEVRRLLTPLYGLKQSARSFQEKLQC